MSLSRADRHRGLLRTTEAKLALLGEPKPGEPVDVTVRRRELLAELDALGGGDVTRLDDPRPRRRLDTDGPEE